jgi:hypothetical protein
MMSIWYWIAILLIGAVLVILAINGFVFISQNKISDPRDFIALTLTSLFVLATTSTLAIIILWGAKLLAFPDSFMQWLGGATVAEVAGILTIIINYYFKSVPPKA